MADVVVGSGPSGVAVASALLRRGRPVIMLDSGRTLEPDRAAFRDRMAATQPDEWPAEDRRAWREPQYHTPPGQIRRYGSDFAMEPRGATLAGSEVDHFALRASRAQGGLSNLWGSALLPYRAADMAGWPISADDLAPHYRAVAEFLPVSAVDDRLSGLFPVFPLDGANLLPPSAQGEVLLDRLDRASAELTGLGITAGKARQAVASGCRQCGMCLHGCPWGLIWSARHTLDWLAAQGAFTYRGGASVVRFAEGADSVRLTLADGNEIHGRRVYLATGVLESARILLASGPTGAGLVLRDSHHGFLPLLHRWRAPRRADRMPLQTLTQAFVELDDPKLSPYLIHAQLYGWNDFYERDLIASYGRRLPGSGWLWRALARRLIVAQIFLHSDHSASIDLTLDAAGHLLPSVRENPDTPAVLRSAAAALGRGLGHAGLGALTFGLRSNPVGSSFHAGATLPMAARPTDGQSDILGRPHGHERLHIVDASILPAIPATTITLPVMANAHRIGSIVPE